MSGWPAPPHCSTPPARPLLCAPPPRCCFCATAPTASAPGAYVFPGGGIDAADAQAHGQSNRRATQSDLHLTQAIAAIRESFEELGILLARRVDGSHLGTEQIAALDRKAPFAEQCAAQGLTLSGAEG